MDIFDSYYRSSEHRLPGWTLFREYYLNKGAVEIRINVAPNKQELTGVMYFIIHSGDFTLEQLKKKLPNAQIESLTRGHLEYDAFISAPSRNDADTLLKSLSGSFERTSLPETLLMKASIPIIENDGAAFEQAINAIIDQKRDYPIKHSYIQSLIVRAVEDIDEVARPIVAANSESASALVFVNGAVA